MPHKNHAAILGYEKYKKAHRDFQKITVGLAEKKGFEPLRAF